MKDKTRIGPMAAAELAAALEAIPGRQERLAEFERERMEMLRQEAPVVEALRQTGHAVDSVWDLVNSSQPYTSALPILLEHLQRDYPEKVREGIARAMAVPESRFAWHTLVNLFRREFGSNPSGVKMALGLAIANCATDDVITDLIALFRDPRHGEIRILFVEPLDRSHSMNAREALEAGRSDPQLAREIRRVVDRPKRSKRR